MHNNKAASRLDTDCALQDQARRKQRWPLTASRETTQWVISGEKQTMSETIERPRVLLVEADAERRALIAEALEQAGFNAATAGAGERALLILRQRPRRVEWLVAGSGLPGLVDGWMLADEFHQAHPGRPVLLASRDADRPSRTHAIVVAPASPAAVVEVLQRLTLSDPQPGQPVTA